MILQKTAGCMKGWALAAKELRETAFVFHRLDFNQGAGAFLTCVACGQPVSMDRWLGESCTGTRPARLPIVRPGVSIPAGSIACALCGDPIAVAPMHRDHVEWFGGTCDACFGLVEAIGADPTRLREMAR